MGRNSSYSLYWQLWVSLERGLETRRPPPPVANRDRSALNADLFERGIDGGLCVCMCVYVCVRACVHLGILCVCVCVCQCHREFCMVQVKSWSRGYNSPGHLIWGINYPDVHVRYWIIIMFLVREFVLVTISLSRVINLANEVALSTCSWMHSYSRLLLSNSSSVHTVFWLISKTNGVLNQYTEYRSLILKTANELHQLFGLKEIIKIVF